VGKLREDAQLAFSGGAVYVAGCEKLRRIVGLEATPPGR